MIITENITLRGHEFIRTYSDNGMMIERNGIRYSEAIDPINSNRIYVETIVPVKDEHLEEKPVHEPV